MARLSCFPVLLLVLLALAGITLASRLPELSLVRREQRDQQVAGEIALMDTDLEASDDDDPSDDPWDDDFCFDPKYRKRTLKMVKEIPFIGLFEDLRGISRFEASGAVIAKGFAWVVFDNLRTIGKVDLHFNFRDPENVLMIESGEDERESQFEGLAYVASSDTFIVVRETFNHTHSGETLLMSRTEEIQFDLKKQSFSVIKECVVHFEFEDVNKGFEGIYYFEKNGKRYFMGLCESNHCQSIVDGDQPGLDRGNGRVIVAEEVDDGEACSWEPIKVIHVPSTAKFLDYSAMAFNGYMGTTVAITSQEDAAIWLGEFDWDELDFVGRGRVLHFPRDKHCNKLYCNVEGVQFIDDQRVVFTSDKSKSTQPPSCMEKDQSMVIMALPKYRPDPEPTE